MPTTLLNTDLNLPHVKRLMVGLSDDDKSLVFSIEVSKPTSVAGAAIPVTVPVTSQQVEILLRLAGK